jgi:glycosyltransferase involved in cell wall biosynthesis
MADQMDPKFFLIAPNVSEQMGGEAMKALHIFRETKKIRPDIVQITHERNQVEITDRLQMSGVHFIKDTWLSRLFWRVKPLRLLLNPWFSYKAVKLAETLAHSSKAVIWQTEPNSPVAPRWMSRSQTNVLGPINGNIYYPVMFRKNESALARWRRRAHMPLQRLQRWTYSSVARADLILVAGGERTAKSLLAAGCDPARFVQSLDCGVDHTLLDQPRIRHAGNNPRFIQFGRLVFHKGTALVIHALQHTDPSVCLDIVGRGPELQRCIALAQSLGLEQRVRFLDWYPVREDLLRSLKDYRAMVLPTLEDANGMVVQESMAMGLPAICLDWGGPQLLVEDGVSGFLVEAGTPEAIARGLASRMSLLARDGELAERMSEAARERAESWRWSSLARDWLHTAASDLKRDANNGGR